VAHNRDGRCVLRQEGTIDSSKNFLRRAACVGDFMLLLRANTASLSGCNVPGMLVDKTVVSFGRLWDSGEE
jgi:hypothetical protein